MKTKNKTLLIITTILIIGILFGTCFISICNPVYHPGAWVESFTEDGISHGFFWHHSYIGYSFNCILFFAPMRVLIGI